MKTCSRCHENKELRAFSKAAASADGLQAWCKKCVSSYRKEWLQRPGVRAHRNKAQNDRYDPRTRRDGELRRNYGLTLHQFEALVDSQNGECAICETELAPGRGTHVDHCHASGLVRGVLCSLCNKGIGSLHDDPELLRKAADYLERNEAK